MTCLLAALRALRVPNDEGVGHGVHLVHCYHLFHLFHLFHLSNVRATAHLRNATVGAASLALAAAFIAATAASAYAQNTLEAQPVDHPPSPSAVKSAFTLLAGGAAGLVAHEGGHLLFNAAFDSDPELRRVEFYGIPFFAITHRDVLSPRREFTISSAGFWVQHAGSEWILSRRPTVRRQHAPFLKGILAFNVLASGAYAGAAFARTGPEERDTRGMAAASRIDERWVGALVLAPAVLDAWRYFDPDERWAAWVSRAVKIGMVLLVLR